MEELLVSLSGHGVLVTESVMGLGVLFLTDRFVCLV
jgi:hypothetical protein